MTTSQTSARLGTAATNSSAARPLRLFLGLDAIVTGGNGLIYLLAAGPVGDLLDMDTTLLRGIGVFLTVYGLLVGLLARQDVPSATATKIVIEANLLWAVASIATAIFGWFNPNTIGTVWIPMQALVVGAFAVLQISALRKLTN
ncbi:Integral membrane protein OS=Streptomyces alboniger OX=132473 GN=CP975_22855 PE=4 SV=1 [Streptomyces alboniger]